MTTMSETMAVRQVAVEAQDRESAAKNILLFFAAPWIGLAYVIAFPFIGIYALMNAATAAARK